MDIVILLSRLRLRLVSFIFDVEKAVSSPAVQIDIQI